MYKLRKLTAIILSVVLVLIAIPFNADANANALESEQFFYLESYERMISDAAVNENFVGDTLTSTNILDLEQFFYLEPCERVISDATINENFADDAVLVSLTRSVSRENRVFTARDFRDVGAVYVRNLTAFSDENKVYAEVLWNAEHQMILAEHQLVLNERSLSFSTEQAWYLHANSNITIL